MNENLPFLVRYSGATPEQFARLVAAEPETIRFPTVDGALFFACRTLARGGTVVRVEGPDGLALTGSEVEAYCRAQHGPPAAVRHS